MDTEIPSPATGILRGIAVDEDETVAVGAQLAVIEDALRTPHPPRRPPRRPAAPAQAQPPAPPQPVPGAAGPGAAVQAYSRSPGVAAGDG